MWKHIKAPVPCARCTVYLLRTLPYVQIRLKPLQVWLPHLDDPGQNERYERREALALLAAAAGGTTTRRKHKLPSSQQISLLPKSSLLP